MATTKNTLDTKAIAPPQTTELITRSEVPPGLHYEKYREYLRPDFFFSCAYCTISECEAQAIRFTIDHYEPKKHRPDLTDNYENLMYCCDVCNMRKGHRMPNAAERARGLRFFRPDLDRYTDHFEKHDLLVHHKSTIGYYTENALDLNRLGLRRLRDIRQRLATCDDFVLGGLLALRRFPLDQLPTNLKGRAARSITSAIAFGENISRNVDDLLRANGRSTLIDDDTESETRARERAAKLKQLSDTLQPGALKATRGGRR